MKKRLLVLFVCLMPILASCGPSGPRSSAGTTAAASAGTSAIILTDTISQATLSRYRANEIREYEGARLDPAVGPGDNSISGIQQVDISNYRLVIDGLVNKPAELTYENVRQMTAVERKITLHCVTGWQATILWRGTQLSELLNQAVVKPEANTVIFHAADGYTTSLPLAAVIENQLILAYDANGIPLPPAMGYPFIVVAEDRLGYKWARWVNRIELSADASYRGYWESRGYSNDGQLEDTP